MKGQKGSAGRKGTPGVEVRAMNDVEILVAQFVITLLPLSLHPSSFLSFFSSLLHFLLSSPLFPPFSLFFFPLPPLPPLTPDLTRVPLDLKDHRGHQDPLEELALLEKL